MSVQLTAAILCAEEVEERWLCPVCGGLNRIDGEGSGAGYCQHDACVERRHEARLRRVLLGPEILFPAYRLDRRERVLA